MKRSGPEYEATVHMMKAANAFMLGLIIVSLLVLALFGEN